MHPKYAYLRKRICLHMSYIIRVTALVSFTFLAIGFSGCGAAAEKKQSAAQSAKPLITPQIVSNKPKIVAFGDSLTAGFGLTERESYPYLLQQRLNADGYNYEVVNAGVSGETSLGGLERIDWVIEQENVKILILELGANDLLRGVPVRRMKDNLDRIIKKAKAKKVTVLLCGMLAPPTMGSDYQRDYSNAFPDLADEHDIAYLPFLLEGVALKKELNQADGIHPNLQGTKVMTANIYKELKPLIAQ